MLTTLGKDAAVRLFESDSFSARIAEDVKFVERFKVMMRIMPRDACVSAVLFSKRHIELKSL